MRLVWHRLRDFVVLRIFHLDDTPHRIALGVAIGLFVSLTPTVGVQMVIGMFLATVLRANKFPAVALAWITNPLTTVPIFYFNWCVGHAVLSGAIEQDQSVREQLAAVLASVGGFAGAMSHLFDGSFWRALLTPLSAILPELLAGSLMVATVAGGAGYVLTLRGVIRYRLHRERRHAAPKTIVLERKRVAHEPPARPTRHSA